VSRRELYSTTFVGAVQGLASFQLYMLENVIERCAWFRTFFYMTKRSRDMTGVNSDNKYVTRVWLNSMIIWFGERSEMTPAHPPNKETALSK
jgi:hypothetical protein